MRRAVRWGTGQPLAWVVWQSLVIAVTRIAMLWLFNNTGKSVFGSILFHAMNNVCTVWLPMAGWPYGPFVVSIMLGVTATIVTFLWGAQTLTRFRYWRAGGHRPAVAAN
jgi:hypothetical protein